MLLIVIGINFLTIKVRADSGWDTSYDSGSSWSSSSSWDSGGSRSSDWGSSNHSSRSGDNNNIGSYGDTSINFIIILIIFVCLFILALVTTIFTKKQKQPPMMERYTLSKNEIHDLDPSLDAEEFYKMVYECFVDVQNAWMNFDYNTLRSKLADELYNQYEMQLETLKSKGQKNIMEEFNCVDCGITNIRINDNTETIEAQLKVTFKDYVVDSSNKVVRGNKNNIYSMVYILTFVRKLTDINDKCPKCGAPIENNAINKCLYCRATISKNNNKFIMSKKGKLDQKLLK